MICAIHQPNLFPWMGYFAKIAKADTFVFLDAVQFPRTSRGTWTNRVKILTTGEPRWLTCPVKRSGTDVIANIEMAEPVKWKDKTVRNLKHSYGKTPFFQETMDLVEPIFASTISSIASFNMLTITTISKALGLTCDFKLHSEMPIETHQTSGSQRLSAICAHVGADSYLAGDGAGGYELQTEYKKRGISFAKNNFVHPTYPQIGRQEFAPGLSILDILFNMGQVGTNRLLTD